MATDPDALPTGANLRGKCPRCGVAANFRLVNHEPLRIVGTGRYVISGSTGGGSHAEGRAVEQLSVIECMGCDEKSVVIEAEINDQYGLKGVLWWPTENLGDLVQAAGVPPEVIDAYSEGIRCLSVHAPNAAAAMFRTVIAQIVQSKGSEAAAKKRTLYDAINQMDADKTMWPDFGDWAHYVRDVGNAGAHGEKYEPVSVEQAAQLRVFIRELINFLYVQPARRAAAKAATKKATTP